MIDVAGPTAFPGQPSHGTLQPAGVLDGPHSVVLQQSENRLHLQKAQLNVLIDQQE
jgi:ornithine carbamoyltransferase